MNLWPPLIINLKQHIVGLAATQYVVQVGQIAKRANKKLIICPPVADLDKCFFTLKEHDLLDTVLLFSQKVDDVSIGDSKTGSICVDSLINAKGIMINHFETRIYGQHPSLNTEENFTTLCNIIKKSIAKNLLVCICADNNITSAKIAQFLTTEQINPSQVIIAIEWDEYIGKISIVKEKPDEIKKAVDAVNAINPNITVYCGAGIQTKEELATATQLGAPGCLAATGFTKAPQHNGDYIKAAEEFFG